MRNKEEVKRAFTPVTKLSEGQKMALSKTEVAFRDLAGEIIDLVPETADRTSALRKLLDAKQTAIHAITHGPSPESALVKKPTAKPEEKKDDEKNAIQNATSPKDA